MLSVGDIAPNFTLLDQSGTAVSLSDFKGKKVLIWFYPKASTPGCTAQGCSLRDNYSELAAKDIVVLGISKDSVKRQANFAEKKSFPFQLLSDVEGQVVEAYGVWGLKKFMGREYMGINRTSFLVDEDGKLLNVISKVKTKTHGEDILKMV